MLKFAHQSLTLEAKVWIQSWNPILKLEYSQKLCLKSGEL